jgi:predicted transcriptional regulator
MLTLEEIRELLLDRRLDMVADSTGVDYSTICGIKSGRNDNPKYKTVKALSDYFQNKSNA